MAVEGWQPFCQRHIAQPAILPKGRAAGVPDRYFGDVLVRREQVMEHRLVRAVERAAQVCPVDVLRCPEGPSRAVWTVKSVKKLEQQAGVLGVNTFYPQPAVFFVLADVVGTKTRRCDQHNENQKI